MTENEAIEYMRELNENYFQPDKPGEFDDVNTAFEVAMLVLEEIQQYRALGTAGDFKNKINDVKTLSGMYEKLSDKEAKEHRELKAYKDIGTLKEFQEAMGKQIPKKPVDDAGFGMCPCCHSEFNSELTEEYSMQYCMYCGQALDRS